VNAQTKVKPPAETVYQKIAAVQAELAKVGISKSRQNQAPGQSYNFRGIDEVYNTLAPMMASHGLCILPRIVEHSLSERGKTKNGAAIFSAIVTAEFDFVSADDGSIHVVRTMGEAMDSSDKATNKAMSAAYKYAALMTFAIPTEGDNDADAHTPQVVAQDQPQPVSDDDWAKIAMLVKATKTPVAEVKDYVGVPNLKVLTADQLDRAIDFLETKLAAAAKAQSEAKQPSLADELGDNIPY
jgi:hypothetical protein